MIKAINRVFQYAEYKGIPHTRLEKEIGLSNGYLMTQKRRNADFGEGVLVLIINYCLDINPIWLLLGQGSMFRSDVDICSADIEPIYSRDTDEEFTKISPEKEEVSCPSCDLLRELVSTQKQTIESLLQTNKLLTEKVSEKDKKNLGVTSPNPPSVSSIDSSIKKH